MISCMIHFFLRSFDFVLLLLLKNHVLERVCFFIFIPTPFRRSRLEAFFILRIKLLSVVWSCDEVNVNLIVVTAPIDIQVERDNRITNM